MEDTVVKSEYDSLELMVMDRNKQPVPYTINKSNINYYRAYVDTDGGLKTSIYFIGNPKALVIECGYDQLQMKLDRNASIYRMMKQLPVEQFKLVQEYVKQLHNALPAQQ